MNHVLSTPDGATVSMASTNVDRSEVYVKSVLFVCWGNVCRSPAGKSVLQKYLEGKDLGSVVRVDSAGVCFDDVLPRPSWAMRWTAFRRGYALKSRARRINRVELSKVDLVIAMDQKVLNGLHALHKNPKSEIKLLSEFLPSGWPQDVPDPIRRGKQICNRVFDMLELACPRIVENLRGSATPTVAIGH